MNEITENLTDDFTRIESIFVRKRNVLMLRASFTGMYTDYYLHLMEQKIRHPAELDAMLKEQLAMLCLHLVARPWAETIAWTVNLRAPRINLFVSGGSTQEEITGRIFTEDVREPDRNFFYSQTVTPNMAEPRLSTLEVTGKNPLEWVEQFYLQSEQRPCRAFDLGDDDYVLIAAQPDYDQAWLEGLSIDDVKNMSQVEELHALENRQMRFFCGCNLERILPVLGSWKNKLDDLFGEQENVNIQCPRCAAKYVVSREMVRDFTHPPEA